MESGAAAILRSECRQVPVRWLTVSRQSCASSFRPGPGSNAPSIVELAQRDRKHGAVLHHLLILYLECHAGRHNNVCTVTSDVVMQRFAERNEIIGGAMLLAFNQNISIPIPGGGWSLPDVWRHSVENGTGHCKGVRHSRFIAFIKIVDVLLH